jgi:putative transposase
MPRAPRIEYPGAIYHVINRGNYRWDVFGSSGAAKAFVAVLEEAVSRFEWECGAYVVMRNHFHLAIRTPQPNLAAGMHWLQTTFATRFNRLRGERGHLFQGRYKALLLEDEDVWARVADYIHLNPVRAHVITSDQVGSFRWSSLGRFLKGDRFQGLRADPWLRTMGWRDSPGHWSEYLVHLRRIHAIEQGKPERERENFTRGWAIGDKEWKQQLLEEHVAPENGATSNEHVEPAEMRQLRWEQRVSVLIGEAGHEPNDLVESGRLARWKLGIADRMQREMGASVVWLAERLKTGKPNSLRTTLWRYRQNVDM